MNGGKPARQTADIPAFARARASPPVIALSHKRRFAAGGGQGLASSGAKPVGSGMEYLIVALKDAAGGLTSALRGCYDAARIWIQLVIGIGGVLLVLWLFGLFRRGRL